MDLSASPETKRMRRESAFGRAYAWRGECLDCFGHLKLEIVQTLDCLGKNRRQSEIREAGFIRARFNELKRHTGESNDFAAEGWPVHEALTQLEGELPRRLAIAHGAAAIRQSPTGEWVMTLKFRPAGSALAEEVELKERDAEDWLLSFRAEVKKLRQRLDALRRRLSD